MNRTIVVASLLLFAAASASAELHGSWTANTWEEKPGRIQMNLARRYNNHGNTMNISDFRGLTDAQVNAASSTPVNFQLAREAGTVSFEGSFRNGDGAGQWSFRANPEYANTLRSMGLVLDTTKGSHRDHERTEEEELFSLAVLNVSTDFIRSMRAEGYDVPLDKIVSMRIFNVTPEYIREMRGLGYKDISADELVASKIHKVSPDYIRRMRAAGWGDLTLDELQASRIHGATPEFAEEMAKLGYKDLPHRDLIAFRIHRVTPEFIRELRELGYDNVRAKDLIAMRIHRVTPAFIRELADAGYKNVPVRKLIDMRIHNIDVKFIEKMNGID
jgi:hypothetical protein